MVNIATVSVRCVVNIFSPGKMNISATEKKETFFLASIFFSWLSSAGIMNKFI